MAPPGDDEMKARSAAAKRDGLLIVKHRVKARMAETGISAAKLATRANLTPRSVQRFLADGERDLHLGNLFAIAAVLLVDVRDLLDPLSDPEKPADE